MRARACEIALSVTGFKGIAGRLPRAKLVRFTPDDSRRHAEHAGLARAAADRREFREEFLVPLRRAWSWSKWLLVWAPPVALALAITAAIGGPWIWWRLRRRDGVTVRLIERTVADGGERAKIAQGTPVGARHDAMKRRDEF